MIKLFKETFQKYTEGIQIRPKRIVKDNEDYYEWRLTAYLDKTFEKLIPDKNKIPEKYLHSEKAFYSLLAALTDCEGSIILRPLNENLVVRVIYKVGMTSKNVMETIHRKLKSLGFKSHLNIEGPDPRYRKKKSMYIIRLYGREAYRLVRELKPYMKHAEKLEKMKLYQRYIELRRSKGKIQAYEILKKELEKLKKKINEETRKSREKAKQQYQKEKPQLFLQHHHHLLYNTF